MQDQSTSDDRTQRQEGKNTDKQRLKILWITFGVYFVIVVIALQFATQVPYQVLALGGLINMGIIACFFVAINKVRRRIRGQGNLESKIASDAPVKYEGLKKLRWLFFALAVIGIAYTPSAILTVVSNVRTDHRLILPFTLALLIRFVFIGFFLKIWWQTGKNTGPSNSQHPTANQLGANPD